MSTGSARRFDLWPGVPARHPWAILALSVAIIGLSTLGILRMRPNASLGAVFGKHDPAASALGRILNDFAAVDEVLLLVSDASPVVPAEVSAAKLRAFGARFETALRADAGSASLVSHITWSADQEFIDYFTQVVAPAGVYYLQDLGPLKERLRPEEMKEQVRRNEAMIAAPGPGAGALAKALLKDPLRFRELVDESMRTSLAAPIRTYAGAREFLSEDGKSLLIRVGGWKPVSDLDHAKAITGLVHRIAEQVGVNPDGLRVEYSGAYAIAAVSERAMRSDMVSNIWGSLIAFQLLFLLAYRGLLSFLLAIVPVAVGNIAAFGVFSLYTTDITPIVAVIGSLLAGIGIEYSIHFLTQYEALRGEGKAPVDACERANRYLAPPILVGCGTSIVGFLAVVMSNVVSVQAFAILGSLGLALSVLATGTVMPAMIVLVERHAPGLVRTRGPRVGAEWLIRIAAARPRTWLAVSGIVGAACVAVVALHPHGGLQFESDLSVMHARPNPPLQAQKRISEKFGDVAESLIVHIAAPTAEDLVSRAYDVDRRLKAPAVKAAGAARSIGLSALLPDPARRGPRDTELAAIDADAAVKDFQNAIAESEFSPEAYAGFVEALPKMLRPPEFPSVATLRRFPSVASAVLPRQDPGPGGEWQAATLVLIDRPLEDARDRDAALDALNAALAGVPGVTATGLAAVSRAVETTVRKDFPYQAGVAAVIVAVINFAFLRRMKQALLLYVPVGCAVLATLAYMGAAGERVNLANMVAVPMLFGLGTDFGIFTIQVGRQSRKEGESASMLITRLARSSHAFAISTMTTILGFGTLVFTSTPALQSLGRIMTVAVVACMLATSFIVVPVVVKGAGNDKPRT